MSNIDKQALREEFQQMQDNYSDPADRDRQVIYIAAEALLDELESDKEKIKTLESRNRRLEGIIDAAEKRIAEPSGQKRLIGWRASDYTDETSDPELAKNWAAAIGVLPIFEGDVNTKLSVAGIGEGDA
ncbi:hypothetical protein [Citrobacter amalonaticus]